MLYSYGNLIHAGVSNGQWYAWVRILAWNVANVREGSYFHDGNWRVARKASNHEVKLGHLSNKRPCITFLFSDTGGGHRSAAEAIIEAIGLEFPGQLDCKMIDIFRQYSPPPLHQAPEIYPELSRRPELWKFGYKSSDGKRRMRFIYNALWPYMRRSVIRLIHENPSDLVVSVHQMINGWVGRELLKQSIPFITIVTDMVTTHAAWYDRRAIKILVPTEIARQRALEVGMDPERVFVVGQPVADRFCQNVRGKSEIRSQFDWPQDVPVVLLVGGGEGMGPVEQVALTINQSGLPVALVIIAGRNQDLKQRLEVVPWKIPVKIYGFVREMPDFMRAADILVTKAGPGTISEAFIAGLPLILYSRMPGQEDGNVTYVEEHGAGVWAPDPHLVVSTIKHWLANPQEYKRVSEACLSLARPQASRRIARILAHQVGVVHGDEHADSGHANA